jgi:site-specific recombinase XerD
VGKSVLAKRSYDSNRWISNILAAAFGEGVAAAAITPAVIRETLGNFIEKGLEGGTVNRYKNTLSGFFHFAVDTGRLTKNPCSEVPKYKEAEPRVRFWPEGSEEEAAVRAVVVKNHPECVAEMDLALHCGARISEQFHLRRHEDIDLKRGILTLTGKTGRRHVPINAVARQALEQLLAESSGEFLIPACKRDDQRDWREWFKECVREAGVKNFHWHDLRHTFASRLVMAGADLPSVMKLMGHSNISQTMRYAHLAPDHLKAAVDRLAPPPAPAPRPGKLRVIAGTKLAPGAKRTA